jgi:hypothetical protein
VWACNSRNSHKGVASMESTVYGSCFFRHNTSIILRMIQHQRYRKVDNQQWRRRGLW